MITCIVNVGAYTTFAAELSEYDEATHPLMTRQYHHLEDVYSSPKFSRYMHKYKGQDHIPHFMVTQGKTVWAVLTSVSANIPWQNKVIAGQELPLSAFAACIL